ncbi:MAG: carboxypeptidase M32 [Phycisphaeraceae bacterium]|nr:carboxypeptidase M32 [Phycisphaeraceae bacterium]
MAEIFHTPQARQAYDQLLARVRERSLLESTASLLWWDQETMMPPGGVEHRSRQTSLMSRLAHQMLIDEEVGRCLQACEDDPALKSAPLSDQAVNLRELRHVYDRARRVPSELVEEISRVTSLCVHAWTQARQKNDFASFAPWLEQVVTLVRKQAQCLSAAERASETPSGGHLWDALADGYEPGCTAAEVRRVFDPLRPRLVDLVQRLLDGPKKPKNHLASRPIPIPAQQAFVRQVAQRIGFDFHRGRLDVSAHPFCSGFHPTDVRMTTRYREDGLLESLGGVLHESGHGLYDQGLPPEHHGTPRGSAVGLAIHESQSRTWENFVGRSRPFWQWCWPLMQQHLDAQLDGLSLDDVYESVNLVQRSLIRTESDEATYNLHIMIRFELELALIDGSLSVRDLPGAWNEKYRACLGIEVPDDARGCMQDIHWSIGSLGYFPTYTLGNLYAAQFFQAARAAIPDLDAHFAAGDFAPLLAWLRKNIHQQGMRHRSHDLCVMITGRPLSADPLLDHLTTKFSPLHGL